MSEAIDRTETAERVLVAFASRMGGTREIAEAIGDELNRAGFAVTIRSCGEAASPVDYDAVVLGSSIYARRWDRTARSYLRRHRADLAQRPVWLFHSGPCGAGAETEKVIATRGVRRLAASIGAEPPTTFGGRLDDAHATGPLSRWMAAGGPLTGDFRDWARIRDWADEIAAELSARLEAAALR